jgi:hypothetical protein
MHLSPAFFPLGIPGIGDEMEGMMQQAPHPSRQSIKFDVMAVSFENLPQKYLFHRGF